MFSRVLIPIILISFDVHAFDPFSVLAGVDAATDLLNSASLDSALDLGDAVTDFMTEAEISPDLINETNSQVKRLEDIDRKIHEARYLGRDIKSFSEFDLSRTRSLASKLRGVAGQIRKGRRIFSQLTKSKNSNVLQAESIKVNYQILDELRNLRMNEFNRYLEDREARVKLQVSIEDALEEERKFQNDKFTEFKTKRRAL